MRLFLFTAGLPLLSVVGCAPAVPVLPGGNSTPANRTDLALGASARLPTGDLRGSDRFREATEDAQSGGVVPIGRVRHGITNDLEVGASIYGAVFSAEAGAVWWRDRSHPLSPALRTPVLVYGGVFDGGHRVGGELPLVVTLDASSVLEAWAGLRVGVEGAWGDARDQSFSMRGVRFGGLLGIAAGFRSFHALVELSVLHEWWDGSAGAEDLSARGVVLVPAFALRLRL